MKLIFSLLILYSTISLVQAACKNNCSYNGICQNNECSCKQNYIGSDCSIKAFVLKKNVPLTTNESGSYVVYHIFEDPNPTIQQLDFKYDNERSCTVQVLISNAEYFTNEYYKGGYVSSGKRYSLNLPSDVQIIGNILTIAIVSKYNSDLTITYGYDSGDSTISSSISIFAIVLPIIAIIIIVIIVSCFFRRIKRMWQERHSSRAIQPQAGQNPVYLQQKYIQPQQMIVQYPQQQVSQINGNEECSICLQSLLNGMPLVITPCFHKFHGNCIFEVLMRQQSCPNCRSYVQPNQLIGLALPNQLQAQLV